MSQDLRQHDSGNRVMPWNPWTSQAFTSLDPFGIVSSCLAVQGAWLRRPDRLAQEAAKFWSQITLLQIQSFERFHGQAVEDTIPPVPQDERFQGPMWTESPYFDAVKEHYLAVTRWLEDAIENTPEAPDKARRKAGFWTRQVLNALAPSNFFWTNPEALYKCLTTGGLSVLCGAGQFRTDLSRADVRMVDPAPFQVGRNLACTPGKVVYRNALLEVIQYAPMTERVHAVPVVIVAPWINRYYILDLDARKSLVRFLVSRGFTVFMTGWKNAGPEARDTELDDYMLEGVLRAVEVAREVTGADQVHAAGYCVGGTILTALMAWLNRDGNGAAPPIGHFTLFAALADFAAPGDIEFFIDRDSLGFLEGLMDQSGYLDGAAMAWSFRMLRSNGLIWHYVVRSYLYGEDPPPFDVLYWNADSTRLPARMHATYLRECYVKNALIEPDALTLGGRGIDLRRIRQPLYMVGTEQDHIAPWKETFKLCGVVQGPIRYVLATSGHIMGIISPPVDPPKRRYWVGDAEGHGDPETWRAGIPKVLGSWWEDWAAWLAERCGPLSKPPPLGSVRRPVLGDAPGTYVLEK